MQLNNNLALFIIFIFLYSVVVVNSFKYLAVFHIAAKSHFLFGESLMKALAEKGHEVYVISPFPQTQPIENYHDIPFKIENNELLYGNHLFNRSAENDIMKMIKFYEKGIQMSENVLKDQNVQQLMESNQTFDAVICEVFLSESLYGLSEHFKAPLVGLSTLGASSYGSDMVGSPSPPSYVPSPSLETTDHMSLFQRLLNLGPITCNKVYMEFVYLPCQVALYKKYFPNAARDMYTVRKNAAAVLVNSHVSISYPRPYMPNHIEVAGMHINSERKPLPQDIGKFIEEAEAGVVYFSIGSVLKSKNMPAAKLQTFLTAFSKLKQRVVWKFEDSVLDNKPDNVFICDWCPQNDILAHENVKVFITHGGLLSITESIYHGTPFIGIPIFGDQFHNIAKMVADGFAIKLDFETLNVEDLIITIHRLINNEKYTQCAKELSARFRDQPSSPRDLAVFWMEFVVRQKGAKYLHCSGLDLNFIQYHNIDVIVLVYGLTILYFYKLFRLFLSQLELFLVAATAD